MNSPLQILGEQMGKSRSNLTPMNLSYFSKKWSGKEASNIINIDRAAVAEQNQEETELCTLFEAELTFAIFWLHGRQQQS